MAWGLGFAVDDCLVGLGAGVWVYVMVVVWELLGFVVDFFVVFFVCWGFFFLVVFSVVFFFFFFLYEEEMSAQLAFPAFR